MKKNLFLMTGLLVGLVLSSTASADPIIGDQYYISPGMFSGTTGTLPIPAGISWPSSFATYDFVSDNLGSGFSSGIVSVNETEIDNGDGTRTFQLLMATTGIDLFPAGAFDGGTPNPNDRAYLFIGDGNPGSELAISGSGLELIAGGPHGFAASVAFFNGSNTMVGSAVNITFSAGSTNWDGTLLHDFGSGLVGQGITSAQLNFTSPVAIPEPTTAMLLGLTGMSLLAGRRRR